MRISLLLTALACLLCFSTNAQAREIQADDVIGIWQVETDEEATEHIKIYQRDGLYFGEIIWARPSNETSGPAKDVKNKNDDLKDRLLEGLEVIRDYKFDGVDTWKDGEFYAYKKGRTASPKLTLIDENHLQVQVKILFVKKTFVWPRVQDVSLETLQSPDKTSSADQ